jgi:hypothetical protein
MDHGDLVTRLEAAECLRPSVRSGRQRLRMARVAVRKAKKCEKSARSSLKPAVSRLNELASGRGSILAKEGPATLYEFWIDVPGYSGPVKGAIARLTQHGDIHQVSDVKGSTKGGLGGAAVGALAFGPVGAIVGAVVRRKTSVKTEIREVDSRQFELEITGPGFAWSTVQDPDKAATLQRFRNLVNARGSHDDVEAVRDVQRSIVEHKLAEVKDAKIECQYSIDVAEGEQAAYDRVWNEYLAIRLPLLLDIRTRWMRSGMLRRFFIVLIGPVTLVAWLTYFFIATLFTNPTPRMEPIKVGGMHIAALIGIVAYYLSRVRLMK